MVAPSTRTVNPRQALAVAQHLGLQQRAAVGLEAAGQHVRQHVGHVVQTDVGDETEPPEVNADQRNCVGGQLARDAEHRSVAAQHDRQVGLLHQHRQRVAVEPAQIDRVARAGLDQRGQRGLLDQAHNLQQHVLQRGPIALRSRFGEDGHVVEGRGHALIMQEKPRTTTSRTALTRPGALRRM